MQRLLVISKVDFNSKNSDGWTPLHIASSYGHEDVAKLLLEDPNWCFASPVGAVIVPVVVEERVGSVLFEGQGA
jgi:ankyrin repeat protein